MEEKEPEPTTPLRYLEIRRACGCNLGTSTPTEQVWGSPPLKFAEAKKETYLGTQDQRHKTSDRYTMNVGRFPNQMTIYVRILPGRHSQGKERKKVRKWRAIIN